MPPFYRRSAKQSASSAPQTGGRNIIFTFLPVLPLSLAALQKERQAAPQPAAGSAARSVREREYRALRVCQQRVLRRMYRDRQVHAGSSGR